MNRGGFPWGEFHFVTAQQALDEYELKKLNPEGSRQGLAPRAGPNSRSMNPNKSPGKSRIHGSRVVSFGTTLVFPTAVVYCRYLRSSTILGINAFENTLIPKIAELRAELLVHKRTKLRITRRLSPRFRGNRPPTLVSPKLLPSPGQVALRRPDSTSPPCKHAEEPARRGCAHHHRSAVNLFQRFNYQLAIFSDIIKHFELPTNSPFSPTTSRTPSCQPTRHFLRQHQELRAANQSTESQLRAAVDGEEGRELGVGGRTGEGLYPRFGVMGGGRGRGGRGVVEGGVERGSGEVEGVVGDRFFGTNMPVPARICDDRNRTVSM